MTLVMMTLMHHSADAQRAMERSGTAIFFSEAPLEDIKGTNNQVVAIIDLNNGEVAVSMLMKGFQFRKALMQEHFNESYVESDKFPKATFTGRIANYTPETLNKNGTVEVTGELTIHGVSRPLTSKVDIQVKEGIIEANTTFFVTVADHEIKIPNIVIQNIAEIVEVTIHLNLKLSEP
jgi:polyisoprenoid-binding protein YceI